jgi:uncharacterized protein YcbK (DUF882 family)
MVLFAHACPACEAADDQLRAACDGVASPGRRGLFAAVLAGGAALASPAVAQVWGGRARALVVRRQQTGESFSGVYWRDGRYDRGALDRLNWVMRDPGMAEATPMDPRLFDILATVHERVSSDEPWLVTSGYRAPETNASRARQSRRVSRVSFHMSGMAADVQLPGRSPLGLARTAAEMQLGGVGVYRGSGFIHLDCGPARRW